MTINANICITLLLLILLPFTPEAQPGKYFRHTGVDEGLSQSTVLGITQDNQGFIWLATRDGLNRFDGHDFKTFYKDTGKYQLPSGFVKSSFKDSQGYIWIGTSNGLRIWHALNNSFYSPDEHTGFATGIPAGVEVWQIYEYPANCIWLLTLRHGLFICNTGNKTIQHFNTQNSPLQTTWVRSMACNADGKTYIATSHDVHEVRPVGNNRYIIEKPCISGLQQDTADIGIQDLIFENNRRLWIGCHNTGIAVWDIEARKFYPRINSYPIRVLYRGKDSSIWAGTFGAGLLRYKTGQQTEHFNHQPFSPAALRSNFIRSLYQDIQGCLWIGTEDEGVSLYNPSRNKIVSYDNREWRQESFKNIRAVYTEGNTVYTGSTISQIGIFNLASEKTKPVPPPPLAAQHYYDIVTQFLPASTATLLVGTYGSGLFELQKQTLRLSPISCPPASYNITRLIRRSSEEVWVCTNRGLYQYNIHSRHFTDWISTHPALRRFAGIYIKTVYEQGDTLWIATDHDGLFIYDILQQKLLPVARGQKHQFLPFAVNDFLPDNNGLWLATYDNGLVHVTVKDSTLITSPHSSRQNHQPVLRLLKDDEEYIWQSTNKGLIRYSPFSKRMQYFNQHSGTQGQEYYTGAGWKDDSGRLWFGGKNGFDCIFPGRMPDAPAPLPVIITGLQIQDQEIESDSAASFRKELVLRHDENVLTISFTSPDFDLPSGSQYLYRMKGIDPQWVRSGNIRQARYTGLPGGTYEFEAAVAGIDGSPAGIPARLQVKVLEPFRNTWPFYLLLLLILAAIIYAAWRYRLYQVEALYQMRNTISRDLHDDIGGTLSSIHILTEVARQKALQQQGAQAAQILEKVNTLALDMVSRMSDTIWAINPSNDNLDKLLERLKNQFLPACTARGIQLEFQTWDTEQAVTTHMNKRKHIYMVIKEALNNALKHSQASKILVQASYSQKRFSVTIADNGKGFDTSISADGNGLKNIEERTIAVKGKATITSAPGEGTIVNLAFDMP